MVEDQWEVEPHSCRWPFVWDFAIADIKQLVNTTNFIVVGGPFVWNICCWRNYILLKILELLLTQTNLIVVGGHLFEIFATRGLGGSYWDTSYIHIFVIVILIRLLEPLHWLAVLFLSLFLIGYWRDWGPPTWPVTSHAGGCRGSIWGCFFFFVFLLLGFVGFVWGFWNEISKINKF